MSTLRDKLESGHVKGQCMNCAAPAVKGRRKCFWHSEAALKPDERASKALERRQAWNGQRTRADGSCASCGASNVPSWYKEGSRCKSCAILDRRVRGYDITPGQLEGLMQMAGGKCMVCGKSSRTAAASLDHRHSDNQVRGLLCGRGGASCNEVAGFWFDDPRRFLAMACYLIDPPARRVGIGGVPMTTAELGREIWRMVLEYREQLGYEE